MNNLSISNEARMTEPREILYEGQWLRLVRIGRWESCERTHHANGMAVIIVAVTPQDEVLFVEQYRVPLGAPTIEMPAGLVGDDHDNDTLEEAARRELIEETGWQANKVEVLLIGPTSSGMSNERIAFIRARDLVKIARTQYPRLLPVVFAELREEHRADRHIDSHAQRVRAADHLQQPALRELLGEHAIFRQQPRVMQPDPVPEELLDFRPVRTRKAEPRERLRDGRLLLARAHIDAREILRALRRLELREMHHIHRRLPLRENPLERPRQRRLRV